jgi:hypothetical protein
MLLLLLLVELLVVELKKVPFLLLPLSPISGESNRLLERVVLRVAIR